MVLAHKDIKIVIICLFLLSQVFFSPAFSQNFTLKYQFESGKTYKYKRLESTKAFGQTQTGFSAEINRDSETFINITPEKVSIDEITYLYFQDTTFVEEKNPPAGFSESSVFQNLLTKKPIKITMSPLGEFRAAAPLVPLKISSQLSTALNEATLARQAHILPLLPQRTLLVGMEWSDKRCDTLFPAHIVPGLGEGRGVRYTTTETSYVVDGVEKHQGFDCLVISWTGNIFIEGKMIYKEREVFTEEETKISGVLHFAVKEGLLVRMSQKNVKESTTAVFATDSAIIPSSMTTETTLQFLP